MERSCGEATIEESRSMRARELVLYCGAGVQYNVLGQFGGSCPRTGMVEEWMRGQ